MTTYQNSNRDTRQLPVLRKRMGHMQEEGASKCRRRSWTPSSAEDDCILMEPNIEVINLYEEDIEEELRRKFLATKQWITPSTIVGIPPQDASPSQGQPSPLDPCQAEDNSNCQKTAGSHSRNPRLRSLHIKSSRSSSKTSLRYTHKYQSNRKGLTKKSSSTITQLASSSSVVVSTRSSAAIQTRKSHSMSSAISYRSTSTSTTTMRDQISHEKPPTSCTTEETTRSITSAETLLHLCELANAQLKEKARLTSRKYGVVQRRSLRLISMQGH